MVTSAHLRKSVTHCDCIRTGLLLLLLLLLPLLLLRLLLLLLLPPPPPSITLLQSRLR